MAVSAVACGRSYPVPDEQERLHIRTACAPIIEWLEAVHAETGAYPFRLTPEFEAVIEGLDPLSDYVVLQPAFGDGYELGIGSYEVGHEWVYYYSSQTKTWSLDG